MFFRASARGWIFRVAIVASGIASGYGCGAGTATVADAGGDGPAISTDAGGDGPVAPNGDASPDAGPDVVDATDEPDAAPIVCEGTTCPIDWKCCSAGIDDSGLRFHCAPAPEC